MVDWKATVRSRLSSLRLTAAAESALIDEIAEHLDDQYRDLRAGGASHASAYRDAMQELEDLYELHTGIDRSQRMPQQELAAPGDTRRGNYLDDLRSDLRYARRTLAASPAFVLFVVITLGLGIGANTTVFTLINTLLLRPLPFERPAELVAITTTPESTTATAAPMPVSYMNMRDYETQNVVLQSLAAYTQKRLLTLQTGGSSQGVFVEFVTANYFSTMGARLAAGRDFAAEGDDPSVPQPVAVMNYGTWQTRFGGAAGIVGTQVKVNNTAVTVIGVAPRGFLGASAVAGPDLWLPISMAEPLLPAEMRGAFTNRSKAVFNGIARLKPGVERSQADANLASVASALAREYPAENEGQTVNVRPITDVMFAGGSRTIVFASAILAMVVGVILLIACSNVANLLLARTAARQGEIAVRVALGASRGRLVRQLLTESVCLGVLSGAIGLAIANGGVRMLAGTLPASGNFVSLNIDVTVLLFTLAVSIGTGLVFGILPAMRSSRAGVAGTLSESRSAGASRRTVTMRNSLLVAQVALSLMLLVTAGLVLRSIQRAYLIDPGFESERLATLIANPGQAGYTEAQSRMFYRDIRARVVALPGVATASWSANMPLWANPVAGLQIEGRQQRSRTETLSTIVNTVDRDYFKTFGVAIEQGREFTDLDQAASTPVAIVNGKLAEDYWPGQSALGKRIQLPGEREMRQVIGVARTANYSSWAEAPQPCVYLPLEQNVLGTMVLYVRTAGDPAPMLATIGRELNVAAPEVYVSYARTGGQIVDQGLFQARLGVGLLSLFGLLALALASVGLYGNLAYAVSQRRKEIGVRMALGANPSQVLRLILRQGLSLVLTGVAIGLVLAIAVGRLLSGMLFGIGAGDPVSLIVAALTLSSIALIACYVPARWATRVDPLVALRHD
ncbi:MAG TPA: ABC transporter permease [Vicinamibacterales bacterium]|nr:ABC transporter permease [Vicinamibacterales bacterium]